MQKTRVSEAGSPKYNSGSAIFLNECFRLSELQFTCLQRSNNEPLQYRVLVANRRGRY